MAKSGQKANIFGNKAQPGTTDEENRDPQAKHEAQMKREGTRPDSDDNLPKARVEILDDGVNINGHPLKEGQIVELNEKEINQHREHGVRLGPVADDDERETYDHRGTWENPQHSEEANEAAPEIDEQERQP